MGFNLRWPWLFRVVLTPHFWVALIYFFLMLSPADAAPVTPSLSKLKLTTLTRSQIKKYEPFTRYAGIAYCPPQAILNWSCPNCKLRPKFKPVASGGDGKATQIWYVGIDPVLKTIIVGHQGTNAAEIKSIANSVDVRFGKLDTNLFPGLNPSIKVHSGFAAGHAKTAEAVRAAVRTAMTKSGYVSITTTGHSLGGAYAVLQAISLRIAFPKATLKTVIYGAPRIGNQAFVDYVNANIPLDRIDNRADPVPTVPGMRLGFRHARGEKHIQDDGTWVDCLGGDNPDPKCSTGRVPNVFSSIIKDHSGPYGGIMIDC